ncbi:MAG: alpha/beta hydrolase family protein [Actinomycetales bacterium]
MTEHVDLPTSIGLARAHIDAAASSQVAPGRAGSAPALVLGHGAGGGVESTDLVALAEALPPQGITVVRVEQPWRVAGKRIAPAPPRLDVAWCEVWRQLRDDGVIPDRAIGGGRSAGARVACRTALSLGSPAVVALAFPLHPPGRPDRSRRLELLEAGVPVLVVQGERDPFGSPAALREAAGDAVAIVPVAGADHALRVQGHTRGRADVVRESRGGLAAAVEAVAAFVRAAGGPAN